MPTKKADDGEEYFSACPHTLFVAHVEAFRRRSVRFDVAVGINGRSRTETVVWLIRVDGRKVRLAIVAAPCS